MGWRDLVRREQTFHVRLLDATLAIALTAGALIEAAGLARQHHRALAMSFAVVCTASLGWRTRHPLPAAFVAITGMLGYQLAARDSTPSLEPLVVLLTLYSVGRHARLNGRRLLLVGLLLYAFGASVLPPPGGRGESTSSTVGAWVLFAVLPCAAGLTVRRRRSRTRLLAANLERLQGDDALRMRRLAAQERHRVARDLHDVVGHCVSVMVIQATGARLVAGSDVVAADQALSTVVSCGREALADLRRTLGVLRRADDEWAGPAPGLAQLDLLIDRACAAGLAATVQFEGSPAALEPGLDLVAYRVVQEALTNAVKHAGPAQVLVTVSFTADALELTVTDDGRVARSAAPASPGAHGLLGMKERVALYGGLLRTGPRPQGGFQVYARLPLRDGSAYSFTTSLPQPPAVTAEPVRRWRPQPFDVAVSGLWLAAMVIEALSSRDRRGSVALNLAVIVAMAGSALWRRRFPLLFVVGVGALAAVLSSGLTSLQHASVAGLYVALVLPYTAGAWCRRYRAEAAIAFWLVGASAIAAITHTPAADLFGACLFAVVAWTTGRALLAERELSASLKESGRRLNAEREERARLAVIEERTRIARELHAMVARHVTVMVVQGEAAQKLIRSSASAASEALRAIEETGREALAQMRRLLGVLRTDAGESAEPRRQSQSVPAERAAMQDLYA